MFKKCVLSVFLMALLAAAGFSQANIIIFQKGQVQPAARAATPAPKADKLSSEDKDGICREMLDDIASQAKSFQAEGYTAFIFDEDLHFFRQSRPDGVVGDLIFVGVFYKDKDLKNLSVEYSPCSLEPESPHLYVGDAAGLSTPLRSMGGNKGKETVKLVFPPRRCFNTSVAIKVKATNNDDTQIEGNAPLNQYDRYRGTLQMGVLFTTQHETAFGLKTSDDAKKYIYNKGPADSGPEYTASLVIYSVLRYVGNIFSPKKHFAGRDIIHDRSFIDSLGAVIGVGLTNPANRFVLGLSYEVAYGINVIGVMEFARLNQLAGGLTEGAEYAGTEDSIPIRRYWDNKIVFGLSLDLRYVTALFSKK